MKLSKDEKGNVAIKKLGDNKDISLSGKDNMFEFTCKNDVIRSKFALRKVKETTNKTKNPIGEDISVQEEVEFKLTKIKHRIDPGAKIGDSDIDRTFGNNGSVNKKWKLK